MKAQASFEFIMTYAWAIALVAVMIGTLVYLNIFDAELFIKPYCEISKEIVCEEASLYTDKVSLRLRNNFEKNVEIHNITISTGINENVRVCDQGSAVVPVGQFGDFDCSWAGPILGSGEKDRVYLVVEYGREQGTNRYTARGLLVENVIS